MWPRQPRFKSGIEHSSSAWLPWLSWQSGRLLTDRSPVRARVGATRTTTSKLNRDNSSQNSMEIWRSSVRSRHNHKSSDVDVARWKSTTSSILRSPVRIRAHPDLSLWTKLNLTQLLVSLDGQDTRFSPWRPGFESRTRNHTG